MTDDTKTPANDHTALPVEVDSVNRMLHSAERQVGALVEAIVAKGAEYAEPDEWLRAFANVHGDLTILVILRELYRMGALTSGGVSYIDAFIMQLHEQKKLQWVDLRGRKVVNVFRDSEGVPMLQRSILPVPGEEEAIFNTCKAKLAAGEYALLADAWGKGALDNKAGVH